MSIFYAPKIKHIPKNLLGRDFITGDIHGAYDSVIKAMKKVGFDYSKDRLFCVGDLIDRGPGSHRVLAFLSKPYVYAVRGNHEDMLLDLYEEGEPDDAIVEFWSRRNGLDWWLDVDKPTRAKIIQALRPLPLIMEVETARGPFGILHADIPRHMSWEQFKAAVEADNKDVIQTALWGRTRLRSHSDEIVEGIGRIFVGHTPQWDGLKKCGNMYGIDTGAVFNELNEDRGQMTFVNAAMQTQLLINPGKPLDRIDARDAPVPDDPFGSSFSR